MSSPTSLKLGPPIYVDPRIRRRIMPLYLIQIWISLIPTAFLLYWYFYPWISRLLQYSTGKLSWSFEGMMIMSGIFPNSNFGVPSWIFYSFGAIFLLIIYVITIIWTAFITRILIGILNLLHKPREGIFSRSRKDKDYFYWNCRNLARIFLFWILHSNPFTFLKITFSYRFFGVHVGKHVQLNHCWISPEFVSIGNNVVIGQVAAVYSFQFQGEKLLVGRVKIEDNVTIGSQSVILPGSTIHEGTIVDSISFCMPFSELNPNSYYSGSPVKELKIPEFSN
ncbi:MAG: acyltransferase [Promethearchaeota archaeon]